MCRNVSLGGENPTGGAFSRVLHTENLCGRFCSHHPLPNGQPHMLDLCSGGFPCHQLGGSNSGFSVQRSALSFFFLVSVCPLSAELLGCGCTRIGSVQTTHTGVSTKKILPSRKTQNEPFMSATKRGCSFWNAVMALQIHG